MLDFYAIAETHANALTGCGQTIKSKEDEAFSVNKFGVEIACHCDSERLVAIWILLCGYDDEVCESNTSLSRKKAKTKKTGPGYGGGLVEPPPSFAPFLQDPPQQYQPPSNVKTLVSLPGFPGYFSPPQSVYNPPQPFQPLPFQPPSHPFAGQGHTLASGSQPIGNYYVPNMYNAPQSFQPPTTFAGQGQSLASGSQPMPSPESFAKGKGTGYGGVSSLDNYYDFEARYNDAGPEYEEFHEFAPPNGAKKSPDLLGLKPTKKLKRDETRNEDRKSQDRLCTQVMAMLSMLLPSPDRAAPTEFDVVAPSSLVSCLLRSSIIDKAAALLKVDSVDHITCRAGLYESLFSFLSVMINYYETNGRIIYGPRTVNKHGHNLMKVAFNQPTREPKVQPGKQPPPLMGAMLELLQLCNDTVKLANSRRDLYNGSEDQGLLYLCQFFAEMMPDDSSTAPAAASPPNPTSPPQPDPNAWQEDLAIRALDDDLILYNSYYKEEAVKIASASAPTGRMRAIYKDINILETSLPPGIFVRYGESRPDIMKVLIIGPKGTPYENGLFEFDLACGLSYPDVAPVMHFRTTGNRRAHFNPNLYNDGHVCLSLLGTWSGEPWRAGKSTLLQVLVSIQAMIFCEEPYCNEPGHEIFAGSDQSKSYDRRIRSLTVKYAMLSWLEKDNGIWLEVASKHFLACKKEVLVTVGSWAQDKPTPRGWLGTVLNPNGGEGQKEDQKQEKSVNINVEGFVAKLKALLKELRRIDNYIQ
jgi:ubiquitin-protein ligase